MVFLNTTPDSRLNNIIQSALIKLDNGVIRGIILGRENMSFLFVDRTGVNEILGTTNATKYFDGDIPSELSAIYRKLKNNDIVVVVKERDMLSFMSVSTSMFNL